MLDLGMGVEWQYSQSREIMLYPIKKIQYIKTEQYLCPIATSTPHSSVHWAATALGLHS